MKTIRILSLLILMGYSSFVLAGDSYRWLHVTIDTPWAIFIFLLPMVLIPVVLMAFLYWKYAGKPSPNHHVKLRKQQDNNS
ncbi:MAG: hypothetical protein ACC707_11705 [Thiohalomonadales bacterium]